MIYRRIIPIAAGAIMIGGGILGFSKSGLQIGSDANHLSDNGLRNYKYIDSKKFELLNAAVFLRHGARTPNYFIESKYEMPNWETGVCYVDVIPDINYDADVIVLPSKTLVDEDSIMDEYLERITKKCQVGQLTLIGQKQSIAFGQDLKRIYVDGYGHLHKEFNEQEIYCRSTKFPRTFYTLKGILAGIYGSKSFDICHRPVIHTMTIETDPLYPNTNICSVLNKFIVSGAAEIAKDPDIIKMKCSLKKMLGVRNLKFSTFEKTVSKDVYKDVSKDVAKKVQCDYQKSQSNEIVETKVKEYVRDDNVTIYAVRDDLYSRQIHNFPVPDDFSLFLPEINRLSSEEILHEYLGGSIEWEDRIAILVSPVINLLKQNMKKVIDNAGIVQDKKGCTPDMKASLTKTKFAMKMQLVACHDTTLIPLLVCLRIYDGQWPIFLSSLIVELFRERSSNDLFARIVYNGKIQRPKLSDTICSTDNKYTEMGLIPYGDLLKFLDSYSFPDDAYVAGCDKALKLLAQGKPVSRTQFM